MDLDDVQKEAAKCHTEHNESLSCRTIRAASALRPSYATNPQYQMYFHIRVWTRSWVSITITEVLNQDQ